MVCPIPPLPSKKQLQAMKSISAWGKEFGISVGPVVQLRHSPCTKLRKWAPSEHPSLSRLFETSLIYLTALPLRLTRGQGGKKAENLQNAGKVQPCSVKPCSHMCQKPPTKPATAALEGSHLSCTVAHIHTLKHTLTWLPPPYATRMHTVHAPLRVWWMSHSFDVNVPVKVI